MRVERQGGCGGAAVRVHAHITEVTTEARLEVVAHGCRQPFSFAFELTQITGVGGRRLRRVRPAFRRYERLVFPIQTEALRSTSDRSGPD